MNGENRNNRRRDPHVIASPVLLTVKANGIGGKAGSFALTNGFDFMAFLPRFSALPPARSSSG